MTYEHDQAMRCKRLVAAVVREAVQEYYELIARALREQERSSGLGKRGRDLRAAEDMVRSTSDVWAWFSNDRDDGYFSFRGACDLLDLDPDRLLSALRKRGTMIKNSEVMLKAQGS